MFFKTWSDFDRRLWSWIRMCICTQGASDIFRFRYFWESTAECIARDGQFLCRPCSRQISDAKVGEMAAALTKHASKIGIIYWIKLNLFSIIRRDPETAWAVWLRRCFAESPCYCLSETFNSQLKRHIAAHLRIYLNSDRSALMSDRSPSPSFATARASRKFEASAWVTSQILVPSDVDIQWVLKDNRYPSISIDIPWDPHRSETSLDNVYHRMSMHVICMATTDCEYHCLQPMT